MQDGEADVTSVKIRKGGILGICSVQYGPGDSTNSTQYKLGRNFIKNKGIERKSYVLLYKEMRASYLQFSS